MTHQRGAPDLTRFKDSAESYYQLHLEAMRTRDFSTRVTASWGLIARGRDSLPYLMLMLRSSNADSREDAAGTLGWLGKDSDGRENLGDYLVAIRINPHVGK